jgi:nucleoside-diphosphate-sugar epimerase
VSGNLGTALADIERNTYILQRHGRYLQDFGKYEVLSAAGRALCKQARANLSRYVLSKAGLGGEANAFAASMERSIRAFHDGLRGTLDPRCSGQLGGQVVEQCTHIITRADIQRPAPSRITRFTKPAPRADALVLGGTGFIGRELVRRLFESGQTVRILTRGRSVPFASDDERLQIVSGDVRDPADLSRAVNGVRNVFHLARSAGGSWKEYYEQDVIGSETVADCCLTAGVRRLVYTSSIVGYSLAGSTPLTEQTPFDAAILRQNKYARAKAEAELRLLDWHRTHGLPVVIVRPGMVIGRGGDLCHGGVGNWNGLGSCRFWGHGRGKLPLVLVEDVARGLIAAMEAEGVEGESFNLVDAPLLSAREYVEEIERFAGVRVQTFPTPVWTFLAADLAKWCIKIALRMPDRYVPSYGMWKGRMASALFDCSKARTILGWKPAADRDALVARGIHVHLVEFTALQATERETIRQALEGNLELGQMRE